jgi:hypothetical protein
MPRLARVWFVDIRGEIAGIRGFIEAKTEAEFAAS